MRRSHFTILRICLLLTCILLSFLVASWVRETTQAKAAREFQTITEDSHQALEARMDSYHLALQGLKGLLNASERLTATELRNYAQTLRIKDTLPGINGIGYIDQVEEQDIPRFLGDSAQDGFPIPRIHPQTESGPHFIIRFIEPRAGNEAALGLDISFEETRRSAAIAARDSGQTQLTGRILLVQEETLQPGFLLLTPTYRTGLPLDTAEDRRAAFLGWVYAPFVGARTLSDLTQSEGKLFGLQVFDGAPDPDRLIYDSSAEIAGPEDARYRRQTEVAVFGRTWTLAWYSLPAFEAAYGSRFDLVALVVGFALTLMLSFVMWQVQYQHGLVQKLVVERTEELRSRVSENESVIDNALVGIVILDTDGAMLSTNAAARRLLELPEDWTPGTKLDDLLVLPENAVYPIRLKHQSQTRPERFSFLDVHANSWETAQGKLHTTVILQDVTEQELAAKRIAKTEERLDLALKGSQIGVFDVDLMAGTSVVSDTWRKIMGVQDADETFDTQAFFMSHIHPDDLSRLIAADRECISGRAERSTTEFRMRLADGRHRWMRSDAFVAERDDSGLALRMLGTQTDITAIRQAQSALKASEDQFRQTFNSAPVGKAILDSAFCFQSVNDAMCALTGYDKTQLEAGMTPGDLLNATDWEVLAARLRAMTGAGETTYRDELAILKARGGMAWGLANANAALDPRTGARIYILQMLDITDAKQMQRMKSEFVASVSHELRTPLTSIKGAIALVQNARDPLTPAAARLLDIATSNVDRLTYLVNDILDLEKIQSGKMSFDLANQSADAILAEAHDQIIPIAQHFGVAIDRAPLPDDLQVRVDRGRMLQVLSNLLSNACKFSPRGADVTLTAERHHDMLRIAVRDRGPGVPEAFLSKLFQPFSQADSSDTRAKGGTGLGLSIAHELVHRMGGEIGHQRLDSDETEFWFTCRVAGTDARMQRAG